MKKIKRRIISNKNILNYENIYEGEQIESKIDGNNE